MALGNPVLRKLAERIAPREWLIPNRAKVFEKLKEDARRVHLLLEIRDARIPFTSANLQFQQFLKWKDHMVVFTKTDLADKEKLADWKEYFKGENYFFVNGYSRLCVARLLNAITQRLEKVSETDKTKVVMVVGMPNVGKTVLVNCMHRIGRRRTQMLERLEQGETGMEPYMTKFSHSYKISYEPPIYAMDTPAVMTPKINDLETGFKLSLTGSMRDLVVGKRPLARYLLAVLNIFPSSIHSKWKADYDAHMFMKNPLDLKKKADQKELSLDDHFIEVKGVIAKRALKFEGDLRKEDQMEKLVDSQFKDLVSLFQSYSTGGKCIGPERTARRLLSLYRVGKLGCYTWDVVPVMNTQLVKVSK